MILAVPVIFAGVLLNDVLYWHRWRARADEAVTAFYAKRREMPREQWDSYAPMIDDWSPARDGGQPPQWFKETPLVRQYVGPKGGVYWDDYRSLEPAFPPLRSAPAPMGALPVFEKQDSGLPRVHVFGRRSRVPWREVVRSLLIDAIRRALVDEDPDAALGSLLAAYKCHRAVLLGNHLGELFWIRAGHLPAIDAIALRLCAGGVFEPRELRKQILAVMPDVPNRLANAVDTHARADGLLSFWTEPGSDSDLIFQRGDCEIVDRLIDGAAARCADLDTAGAVHALSEFLAGFPVEPDTVPSGVRTRLRTDVLSIASAYRFASDYHRCTLEVLRLWNEGETYDFVWQTRSGVRRVALLPPPEELLAIFDVRRGMEIGEGELERVTPGG